jgi:hypothetical protein
MYLNQNFPRLFLVLRRPKRFYLPEILRKYSRIASVLFATSNSGSREDAKVAKETKRLNHYSRDIQLACPTKKPPAPSIGAGRLFNPLQLSKPTIKSHQMKRLD